jgi:transposase
MKTYSDWAPGPDLRILAAERQGVRWVVTAEAPGPGCCPGCDRQSQCRHGWRVRHLQDLPVQGAAVTLNLKIGRWRCRDPRCDRRTFTARLPLIAEPFARRTRRVSDLPISSPLLMKQIRRQQRGKQRSCWRNRIRRRPNCGNPQ